MEKKIATSEWKAQETDALLQGQLEAQSSECQWQRTWDSPAL